MTRPFFKHKNITLYQANILDNLFQEEFIEWTNGLWTFSGESKKKIGHPAPFPRELPKRCIKLFSYVGDTVFDPFCGSGTTLLEAYSCNRIGVGVEIDHGYCELIKSRLITEIGELFYFKSDSINENENETVSKPDDDNSNIYS